jgi:fermentation-respiration switch protein FrsA (DUF1100 family)
VSVPASDAVTARRAAGGRALSRPRVRAIAAVLAIVALFGAGAYLAAGMYVYNDLAAIGDGCASGPVGTPAAFAEEGVDTTPYLMPRYEDVRFPSRDPRITVAAWFVGAPRGADGPAVIVVHGLGDCRGRPFVLLPAGMLSRNGTSVLIIDLRDHGDSTFEDGRHAGGTEEYQEVLGAWDWLRGKGYAAERIGLFGESLGAGTVLIAAGQEPRVAAVWEDSSYARLDEAIDAELRRDGYPTFLSGAGIFVARLVSGDDLASLSPEDAARKLGGRPVFITHGTADTRLSVAYAGELAAAVRQGGGSVDPWIVQGVGHIDAVSKMAAEYERRLVDFFKRALG